MKNDRERLRESYRPERVRVLFVGEAPPASGAFFYRRDSGLYRALSTTFEEAFPGSGAAISWQLFATSGAIWWTCAGARWIVSGPGSAGRRAGWVRRGSRKHCAGCTHSRSSCCSVRSMRIAHGRRGSQLGAGCASWFPIPGVGCAGATSSGRSWCRRSAAGSGMKCSAGCDGNG